MYKDDKKDGVDESYNDNGTISSKTMYKDDKKNGLDELFHENGNIWVRYIYKDDKKNGKGIYKWSDGATYEGDWKDNLRHGNGI